MSLVSLKNFLAQKTRPPPKVYKCDPQPISGHTAAQNRFHFFVFRSLTFVVKSVPIKYDACNEYTTNIGSLKGINVTADINVAHTKDGPHMGVSVFFNPRWVAEIKISARTLGIVGRLKLRKCRQRIVIINTVCRSYHIPVRWWVLRCDPASCVVVFSDFIVWNHNGENGEHVFWCKKQHGIVQEMIFGDMSIKRERSIAFTYLDVERIEHHNGTILWQKKR